MRAASFSSTIYHSCLFKEAGTFWLLWCSRIYSRSAALQITRSNWYANVLQYTLVRCIIPPDI